jgi:hypothetical protein
VSPSWLDYTRSIRLGKANVCCINSHLNSSFGRTGGCTRAGIRRYKAVWISAFPSNVHYLFGSPLTMKAGGGTRKRGADVGVGRCNDVSGAWQGIRYGSEGGCSSDIGRPPQGRSPSAASRRLGPRQAFREMTKVVIDLSVTSETGRRDITLTGVGFESIFELYRRA